MTRVTSHPPSPHVPATKPLSDAAPVNLRKNHAEATSDPPAPPASQRVATIDVGSNSIRLLVAELNPDGSYRLLDDEKEMTRLGRGTTQSSDLDPKATEDSVRAIRHMRQIAEGYGATMIRAVATCAVREADNGPEFVRRIREEAGVELTVIDGDTEARLAWLSVCRAFDLRGRDVAVVDIGGASTEVVLGEGGIVKQVHSFSLGTVRLAELVPPDRRSGVDRLRAMRAHMRRRVRHALRWPATAPQILIGVGGTFTTLATMHLLKRQRGRADDVSGSVRGYILNRADVRRMLENLAAMTPAERLSVPGLSPDRADLIVPGLVILETMMQQLRINTVKVHDRGIRDGLLIAMAEELFPRDPAHAAQSPTDRLETVRAFAQRCHYEQDHSEHVTELARSIMEQLAGIKLPSAAAVSTAPGADPFAFARDPAAKELLEAAAVLHDIGYYINYAQHHKHSLHLIIHSDLSGFLHRELRIIANVARYHRRSHPKRKRHAEFGQLSESDRQLVMQLSAILRIADGLDRAHSRQVSAVRVVPGRRSIRFIAEAPRRPEVELWGAERKSRLFEKVFGLIPHFEWAGDEGARP